MATRCVYLNKVKAAMFCFVALFFSSSAFAQYTNVAVTGYNSDQVADSINLPTASTTVTADLGVDNGNYVFVDGTYQYNNLCAAPTANILPASRLISSTAAPGLVYQLQPYNTLNTLRVPATGVAPGMGKLFVNTPLQAANIYLLAVSGGGAISAGITVTVTFTDSTNQVFSNLTTSDWCNTTNATNYTKIATTSYHRVQATTATCGSQATCQYFAEMNLALNATNYTKSVAYITINKTTTSFVFNVYGVGVLPPCVGPPIAQPTILAAQTTGAGFITGTFTHAVPAPSGGYLTVRYPQGTTTIAAPTNGTQYNVGQSLGLGTVVSNSATNTFTASGLSGATTYDFYIYSYSGACAPLASAFVYLGSPLTGSLTTNACGNISGVIPIGNAYNNTPGNGYTSIANALNDINTIGLGGNTVLELQQNYDGSSTNEIYPLTFPSNPCVNGTRTLTIRPALSVASLLTMSSNSAVATVDFSGANSVVFDGRPGGIGTTSMLSIVNTNTTGVAIRFVNDASKNVVTYCDVQGQNTSATLTALSGVIYFGSTNTALLQGNDSNTISFCNIHSTSGGFSAIGVASFGLTTPNAAWNEFNQILNCNIYDFFSASLASTAIKLDGGSHAFTIANNRVYQTASRVFTTGNQQRAFWLTPTVAGACGFQVLNNFIGGNNSNGTGVYTVSGANVTNFWGMDINHTGTIPTSVQGNTITNISLTSTTTTANDLFRGISTGSTGHVNIGTITGNIIGSDSVTGAITLVTSGAGSTSYGIKNGSTAASTDTIRIANNIIGGITATSSVTTNGANLMGIGVTTASYTFIDNNKIGSLLVANSLNASNPATGVQSVHGIRVQSGTYTSITNNVVANLNNGYISTGTTALMHGISVTASTNSIITGNQIKNLTTASTSTGTGVSVPLVGVFANTANPITMVNNTVDSLVLTSTSTTVAVNATGIVFGANGASPTHLLTRNFIKSIEVASANPNAIITGIDVFGGSNIVANNMIRLGITSTGNAIANAMLIRGLFLNTTTTTNVYHNSVFIGGNGVGSTAKNTMAFYRNVTSGTHDIKNNIFVNDRSNATTGGKHYQVYLASATGVNIGNNIYYGTGTGSVFGTTNNASTDVTSYTNGWLANDLGSNTTNPQFINTTGTSALVDLHINASVAGPVEGSGVLIASITDDYDGQNRSTNSPVDIGADAGNFTAVTMTVDSTIVTQNISRVLANSSNQVILSVRVHTQNIVNPIQVSRMVLNTIGTTSVGDITNAKIFYTAGSPIFSASTQFGSSVLNPSGQFGINGNVTLASGVNYFWVTYDVKNTAAVNNLLDASVDSIVLSGNNNPLIANGNPTGARLISAALAGNYNVGIGQTFTTITQAIADLNVLGVSNAVTFNLTDLSYSTAETFPIVVNAFQGASTTNTVTLRPASGNVGVAISGNTPASIFDLNGVNYFTIEGRPVGMTGSIAVPNLNYLTIANISTVGVVVKLSNEASFNQIMYCDVQGANTTNATTLAATPAGAICFAGTTGLNGNDKNTIDNCNIHSINPANVLTMGVYAYGTTSGTIIPSFNDSNTISNCNVYDIYGDVSLSTAAILIERGNNAWTINGNSFFHTVNRTPALTAAVNNRSLWINTVNASGVGNGFTITNNYFGGMQPMAGGTPFTFAATNAFGAMYNAMDISVVGGTATNIKSNVVTNLNLAQGSSTTDLFRGIVVGNNGNVNIGGPLTTDGNLIGSTTTTGAITLNSASTGVTPSHVILIGGGTNTTNMLIQNNSIGGITLVGTGNAFSGIFCNSSTNIVIDRNLIGSTTIANSINASNAGTSAQFLRGISLPSGSSIATITNNIVANINNSGTSTTTATNLVSASITQAAGIYIVPTTASVATITGNIIRNLSCAAPQTSGGLNSALLGIGIASTTVGTNLSGNSIDSLVSTSASLTAAVVVQGICFAGSNTLTNTIAKNWINNLDYDQANTNALIRGIDINNTARANVLNNMIRLGIKADASPVTNACVMIGVLKSSSGVSNVYHNSVYIGGSGVTTTVKNTAAYQRTTTAIDEVRNNIFVNNRSNATTGGKHYQVLVNNSTTLTVNNNIYFGNGTGAVFASANGGTTDTVNYKIGWLPSDANSVSANPNFIDATANSANVNLHLHATLATPAEGSGAPLALVTDDYDGQDRSLNTPTDIGADAGNFTALDLASPIFGQVIAPNTASTADRTITVGLIDNTGVQINVGQTPKVYFYKSSGGVAGSYANTSSTLASGTAQNGQWSFTISASAMGGLTTGDSVYFYMIAEDALANTGSLPAGANATGVNSVTTPPATLFSYKIVNGYSGNYNVGFGNTFTTLTNAGGIFDSINNGALSGNVTLTITSDITEDGTHGLNQWAEGGVGNYTVTIVPDGTNERTIAGSVSTAGSGLIRFNGADRVTIDGRFNNTGKYLRFRNRAQAGTTFVFLNDAKRDTIKHCIVEGINNTTGTILFGGSNVVGGTGNDSNAVTHCVIRDTLNTTTGNVHNTGISSSGTNGWDNSENTISNNEIINFGYNAVNITNNGAGNNWVFANNTIYQNATRVNAMQLIFIQGGSGHSIINNNFGGSAPDRSGAAFTSSSSIHAIVLNNTVTNTLPITISGNTISNMATTGTTTAVIGVNVGGGGIVNITNNTIGGGAMPYDTIRNAGDAGAINITGGTCNVTNNLISDYRYYAASTVYRHAGIYASTGTHNITNNTLKNIEGNNATTSSLVYTITGIYIAGGANHIIEGNNISNIKNFNTGTAAYQVSGISLASGTGTVSRNRLYHISAIGTGTGANAVSVFGTYVSVGGYNLFNNQISVGAGSAAEAKVYGIQDISGSGNNNYTYNTILVNGMSATGANATYGINRTSTGVFNATNNIIYNKRYTGGTGLNFAIGSTNAITSAEYNYNLFVVNDTANFAQQNNLPISWSAAQQLYNTSPNTNWIEQANTLPTTQFFVDTAIGNLALDNTNPICWYANGKGMPVATPANDFNNIARSTSVQTSSTDIGSTEFTTSTTPPAAIALSTPALNTTTNYLFGGRTIASVNWGATGSVPSSLDVRYFTGTAQPQVLVNKNYFNAYYNITPSGGSSYSFNLNLHFLPNIMGNVTSINNTRLARYAASTWNAYLTSNANAVNGNIASVVALTAFGDFTGTDVTNALPVTLVSFTGNLVNADVMLNWTTSTEINNLGFDVEKSVDGKTFATIGFVKSLGNGNNMQQYKFTDKGAFETANQQTVFYRLKQLDVNGKVNYSPIINVNNLNATTHTLVYPNPFSNVLTIDVNAIEAEQVAISIIDLLGNEVLTKQANVQAGSNTIKIWNVSDLKQGVYFIKVKTASGTISKKLIKS